MTWLANNLWELLGLRARPSIVSDPPPAPRAIHKESDRANQQRSARPLPEDPASESDPADRSLPMQERYDAMVRVMKSRYGLRVRKWRSSSSGCAWEVSYRDGSVSRLIESPYPRGPMSCAIFLHEVGHHAIGLGAYRPRCLEEYHAWRWSLEQMRALNLNVTAAVERRMHESLYYALHKATRRGLKTLPEELGPYVTMPERFKRGHQAGNQDS